MPLCWHQSTGSGWRQCKALDLQCNCWTPLKLCIFENNFISSSELSDFQIFRFYRRVHVEQSCLSKLRSYVFCCTLSILHAQTMKELSAFKKLNCFTMCSYRIVQFNCNSIAVIHALKMQNTVKLFQQRALWVQVVSHVIFLTSILIACNEWEQGSFEILESIYLTYSSFAWKMRWSWIKSVLFGLEGVMENVIIGTTFRWCTFRIYSPPPLNRSQYRWSQYGWSQYSLENIRHT